MRERSLSELKDRVAGETMDLWLRHRKEGTEVAAPHLALALAALARAKGRYLSEWLLEALRQGESEYLRQQAAGVLWEMGAAAAAHPGVAESPLEALWQGEDWYRRQWAADTLGGMGAAAAAHPGVLEALLEMLRQGENENLRQRAANVLGGMGAAAAAHPGVVESLLEALWQGEGRVLRSLAADALGRMGERYRFFSPPSRACTVLELATRR